MGSECGEIGLACPPLDDLNFPDLSFSLSPDSFFRGIDDDGNVRNHHHHHHHNHKESKRYGIGKDFRLLEKLYKPSPNANEKVDDDVEKDAATFGPKFECAKRKLQGDYEQVAREKKRRKIQLISLSDLPKCPPLKQCRVVKRGRTRFAPALKQPKFAACH